MLNLFSCLIFTPCTYCLTAQKAFVGHLLSIFEIDEDVAREVVSPLERSVAAAADVLISCGEAQAIGSKPGVAAAFAQAMRDMPAFSAVCRLCCLPCFGSNAVPCFSSDCFALCYCVWLHHVALYCLCCAQTQASRAIRTSQPLNQVSW